MTLDEKSGSFGMKALLSCFSGLTVGYFLGSYTSLMRFVWRLGVFLG